MAAKPFRTDAFGHPLDNWDDHQDCRTYMHSKEIFCARGTPCSVCAEWTEEKWRKWDSAINSAARKIAKRASLAQQKVLAAAAEAGRGLAPATPAFSSETGLHTGRRWPASIFAAVGCTARETPAGVRTGTGRPVPAGLHYAL